MKKILLIFSILAVSAQLTMAQDAPTTTTTTTTTSSGGDGGDGSFKSKNGHEVLPQAGEWGLGISASAPLQYFGNMFSAGTANSNGNTPFQPTNNVGNAANWYATGTNTAVFLKKFTDSKNAFRLRLQLAANTAVDNRFVARSEVTPDVNYPNYVVDQKN
jgi:hypothetical protein